MIEIELKAGEPEYLQIAQQIRWAVANGRLKMGERLEPVRSLARRLGVNPSTVARSYRLLEMQGVVETHQRAGTTVSSAGTAAALQDMRQTRLRQIAERTLVEALALGFSLEEIDAALCLQLAAWGERRQQAIPLPPPAVADRLFQFAGSHDLALEALWSQARRTHPNVVFSVRYVGSLEGLLHLLRGEVGLAGTHMLDEESGQYNLPILRRLFVGQHLCVLTVAEREQGLMAAPGNPKSITGLEDLARPDVRLINRQAGSGTRALLDYHLRRLGVSAHKIAGYEREVVTHTAVANAVASGSADVGLGVRAAAQAFSLHFIPLARERYDLVTLAEDRNRSPIDWLLDTVASPSFKAVVAALSGYDATATGVEQRV
jgi:putative molybdopterin biosynthesis protein